MPVRSRRRLRCWSRGARAGPHSSGGSESREERTQFSPYLPGDEDGQEPPWTSDTSSRGTLTQRTPAAGIPGPTLTTGSTRSPGHPSPVPRVRGDTGEACGWGKGVETDSQFPSGNPILTTEGPNRNTSLNKGLLSTSVVLNRG